MSGHAIEARLNAEDPAKGFLPSIGPIVAFDTPSMEGLRVDAGVEKGSVIPPFYDSMIGKLIASGSDRDAGHRPPRARAGGDGGRRPQDQRRLPACARHASGLQERARWTPA